MNHRLMSGASPWYSG